jgi:hypothetical protein
MGAVASSAVTINDVWYSANTGPTVKNVDATIVLSSQGGLTNNIPASLFGMASIKSASNGVDSAGSVLYPCGPSYAGAYLCVYDMTNATDATRSTPADVSVTLRVTVTGLE